MSAIFSGLLKSTVRAQSSSSAYKPSITIQPFNMVHLDITAEGVHSLEEALRHHGHAESIGGS